MNDIYIDYRPTEDYFATRITDDSMKSFGLTVGDIVVCHKQAEANTDDIIVAILKGEKMIARYHKQGAHALLTFENSSHEPIIIGEDDELIILGKVVETRHFIGGIQNG